MKILICTIIRNQEKKLNTWYNQIKNIVNSQKEIDFSLSVYENNSTDQTKEILRNLDFSFFNEHKIVIEDLIGYDKFYKGGYEPYSDESKHRVKSLSECRNKCIFNDDIYKKQDYILFIEPDITYEKDVFIKLYENAIKTDSDIITPASINNDRSHFDKWGTRFNKGDKWCDLTPFLFSGKIFNKPLSEPVDLYASFNCMALYKSKPIIEGAVFGYNSDVIGTHDCDTVVICENFRKMGYNNIKLLCDVKVMHSF